jgi:5-keto-L-gluconate epimerase
MKFSVTVTPIKPKFGPIVFTGGISEHLRLIADLGYDAIELHVSDPATLDRKALRKELDSYGLTISQVGPGLSYTQDGLSWSHSDPEIRKKAIQRIKDHVDFCSEYGAALAIGGIRGQCKGADEQESARLQQLVIDSTRECARYAEGTAVILGIEPINRYETSYLLSVPEVIEFAKQVGSPAVGVLADTFHMNIEDVSIVDSIKQAGKQLAHIHLSDSNRWAPGFGHLDIAACVQALKDIDYQRYISFEVLPKPSPKEAAAQGIKNVKSLL